jgi:hypothetical protein
MKKIFLFAAMALTLVGCTEDYKDWTVQKPDTTPDAAVSISQNMTDVAAIDFANVDLEGDVQLFVPTYSSSVDADSVTYTAILYNADKSESIELPANSEGKVSAAAIKEFVQASYGKLPEQKMVPAVFIARVYAGKLVNKEIHEATLDITIPYHGKTELRALAVPGSHQGWDPANYGQALYETDPENKPNVFTGYVYMDAGTEFKFTDGGSWDVNWGTNDGSTLEPGAPNIKVDADGCYFITVDLPNLKYTMEKRDWSLVGDGIGGWDKDVDLVYSKQNNVYYVTYDFDGNGEFKFRANHGWDVNLGIDKDGEPGDLIQDGKNIPVPGTGTYSVTLSFVDGYAVYEIIEGSDITKFPAYIYEAGCNNGWGEYQQPLYGANGDGKYVGYFYAQEDSWTDGKGAFKFRGSADSWDNGNWGTGSMGDDGLSGTLVNDGNSGNIMPEPGFYRATVDIAKLTFELTPITTIGIVGPAQAGGWDADTDMTYNKETHAWEATIELGADEFKFRANDAWGINWGGSADNLTQDGSNLRIDEAGTYFIQFFPLCETKSYCTITKK